MHQDKAELYVRIVPFTNADHKRISRNKNNPLQRIKVSNNTTLYTISSYIHGQASSADQSQLSVSLHVPFSNKCVQLPLSMSVADFLLITNQVKQGELRYRFDKTDEQQQQQQRNDPQQSTASATTQNNNQQLQLIQNSNDTKNNDNNSQYSKSNKLNTTYKQELNYQISSINPSSGIYPYDAGNNNNFNNSNIMQNFAPNSTNINDYSLQHDSPPYPMPDFPQPSINTDSNTNSIFQYGLQLFSNSFNSFSMLDTMNNSNNQLSFDQNQNAPSKESISLKNDLEQILRK